MVSTFVAGNLRFHVNKWKEITRDSWVIQTVQGLKITLTEIPSQDEEPPSFRLSKSQRTNLSEVIDGLLQRGVVEECSEEIGQVISNVFLRPKPNNKFRLILDLNQFNKKYVEYQHFKMSNLKMALDLITPGMYMSSIDLSDAYFTVPIHISSRKYLRFRWDHKLFQFAALPNGLACAPRLFTKLLNPVFMHFRQKGWSSFQYIDDSIVLDKSFQKCKQITENIAQILRELGFFIHETKSQMIPKTNLVFLGFLIDSVAMQVSPTLEKRQKIVRAGFQLLQSEKTSIREVAGFVGLAGSYTTASDYGANHTKYLELAKNRALAMTRGNYEGNMILSQKAKEDITWWLSNAQSLCRDF